MRLATWHGELSRKGPGLLVAEFQKKPPDLSPILAARPDVLLLTDIDFDAGLVALSVVRDALEREGLLYPYLFARRPNSGQQTSIDIDGDGYRGGPRDAQGYGWFSGQGGMAILSRYPLTLEFDFTDMLWRDVPDSLIAESDPAYTIQKVSSVAHWGVRVETPKGSLHMLTLAATPPVFDGPEDRNGRRNRDEVMLWLHVLAEKLGPMPEGPVAIMGNFNLDPVRGSGLKDAVRDVLDHPRFLDPLPGVATVEFARAGPMRVSYVLPEKRLQVSDSGITAPAKPDGRHRLVWVDVHLE